MRRLVVLILLISTLMSLSACGSKNTSNNIPTSTEKSEELVTPVAEIKQALGTEVEKDDEVVSEEVNEENDLASDMTELEAIGDVEVENGILTVSITMPADLVDDATTQEELNEGAGEYYQTALLNEDGSVTYKMTKAQHRAMLNSFTESFDQALQEMIDDNQTYRIAGIKHNEDYTVFDVTEDNDTLGFTDSFSVLAFYMYGGIYNIFSGNKVDNIVVNFYGPSGNLIQSVNSADKSD